MNGQSSQNNGGKNIILLKPDEKTVVIEHLSLEDEEMHDLLRKMDDRKRGDFMIASLKIGVIGLKRIENGQEMDYIHSEFDSMITRFGRLFDPTITNSYLYRITNLLQTYFDKGGTIERIFDPLTGGSPLNKLRCDIKDEFRALQDAIIKKKTIEEISNKTPLKGRVFEDECEDILSEYISQGLGDYVERTTNKVGIISNSFKGDFLIGLGDVPDKTIAIETKDVGTISGPEIIKNLQTMMENRQAKYGIFCVKYRESLPKQLGWFHEYNNHMIVCALATKKSDIVFPQILPLAIQWAKQKIRKETNIQEEAFSIMAENLAEIRKKLERFSLFQTQCSNIERGASEIREISKQLKDDIFENITKIQHALSSSTFDSKGGEK